MELVPSDGVTGENDDAVAHGVQESCSIDSRYFALVGFPFPVQVSVVWAAVLLAVLKLLNEFASGAVVEWFAGVRDPVSLLQITFSCKKRSCLLLDCVPNPKQRFDH